MLPLNLTQISFKWLSYWLLWPAALLVSLLRRVGALYFWSCSCAQFVMLRHCWENSCHHLGDDVTSCLCSKNEAQLYNKLALDVVAMKSQVVLDSGQPLNWWMSCTCSDHLLSWCRRYTPTLLQPSYRTGSRNLITGGFWKLLLWKGEMNTVARVGSFVAQFHC